MKPTFLTINKTIQRRFILGQQGLYPGRRWRGKAGVAQALRAGGVVQIDPLCVIARSHDLALYGRVLDYRPEMLNAVLYEDRAGFDWGGTVYIYPMEDLPFLRVVMANKANEPRWARLREEHHQVVDDVLAAIRTGGPVSSRQLPGEIIRQNSYRSGKDTAQVLYALWLSGDLMTHSRRGFERLYDLRERVVPPHLDYSASVDESDAFFALKVFHQRGMLPLKSWRSAFIGQVERKVTIAEAEARIDALLAEGKIAQVALEEDPQTPRFLLAEHLPLLESLQAGRVPEAWQPLEDTTQDAMVFLAPLEMVSARGRALPLFDFEYIWEVYKPIELRRWGYYTLPVLYGDRLVARFDSKLDRASKTLQVLKLWVEQGVTVDDAFLQAMQQGFQRFRAFLGAEHILWPATLPINLGERV